MLPMYIKGKNDRWKSLSLFFVQLQVKPQAKKAVILGKPEFKSPLTRHFSNFRALKNGFLDCWIQVTRYCNILSYIFGMLRRKQDWKFFQSVKVRNLTTAWLAVCSYIELIYLINNKIGPEQMTQTKLSVEAAHRTAKPKKDHLGIMYLPMACSLFIQ